jgi:hypothetical protein
MMNIQRGVFCQFVIPSTFDIRAWSFFSFVVTPEKRRQVAALQLRTLSRGRASRKIRVIRGCLSVTEFPMNFRLPFFTCHSQAQPVRVRIMNRSRVTYFLIFLMLFCCTPAWLKAGGYGEYRERRYRVGFGPADTERVFDQIMQQRDIKMAINTLLGEGFTSGEIQDAVQNRFLRIPRWHWPGNFCSASGKIGEPGEGTVVGPTYYLIIGRARILRYIREVPSSN